MDDSAILAKDDRESVMTKQLAAFGYNMGDDCCPKCGCQETRNGICRECGLNVEEWHNLYGREP